MTRTRLETAAEEINTRPPSLATFVTKRTLIPAPSSTIEYVGVHATYQILRETSGQWWLHLVAANGRVIATSSEHYKTKAECLEAIELVKSSSVAPVKAA